MAPSPNQSEFQTDTYLMAQSSTPPKSGLDTKQKKILGISAATLLLGGAAWAIKADTTEQPSEGNNPASPPTTSALPIDIDVAGKVTENMTFEQAYEAARHEVGMGGVFSWHGSWYNTFEKEEWSSLSLEQRQEFTEMVTQEHLPVKPYSAAVKVSETIPDQPPIEPTIIEGHLNGQRVMGLDFDRDGIIDTLVMEGEDGNTYRVVDATGDQGLDTLFRYDSLSGELTQVEKIDAPFVLSNDQFSQGLEESMSHGVVESILQTDAPANATPVDDPAEVESEPGSDHFMADANETDDTYINDGDVHEMDE
ncbi:hypothetical protein [Spirosoma endbachense]|uniref:Uncharacterized protein n=1 Tax=Spirosoma endbachense TaxID=2666025 RepID=A0A6P1VR02_9BACT|nr:hypothetical protein [Spirosoma endbachense]QHV94029.1 hypothetical protein GJR95_02855 [Spirosoma endbachense]